MNLEANTYPFCCSCRANVEGAQHVQYTKNGNAVTVCASCIQQDLAKRGQTPRSEPS